MPGSALCIQSNVKLGSVLGFRYVFFNFVVFAFVCVASAKPRFICLGQTAVPKVCFLCDAAVSKVVL